jgi:hypothetical protein
MARGLVAGLLDPLRVELLPKDLGNHWRVVADDLFELL